MAHSRKTSNALDASVQSEQMFAVAGIAYVQYSSSQAAAYARQKLDGFEYPPGYRVAVRYYRGNQGGPS